MEKIYFISDSHLGIPDASKSLSREKRFVGWLEQIKADAAEIYLLGDIFDFWFEYRDVVPKGYVRLLGKLTELADSGIRVHYFTGNHDMWAFHYFEKELGLIMHRHPIEVVLQGRRCLIGHGDGLGPGDKAYKFLKTLFSCRLSQRMFAFLHPRLGVGVAMHFSRKSRLSHSKNDKEFLGEERESLIAYSRQVLKGKPFDYFIFGHRHYPIIFELAENVRFINTGDWINHFSYAVMAEGKVELKRYAD